MGKRYFEFAIAIFFIILLYSFLMPYITGLRNNAKRDNVRSDIRAIKESLHSYYMQNGTYPRSDPSKPGSGLDILSSNSGIMTLNKIPTDPFTKKGYKYLTSGEGNKYMIFSECGAGDGIQLENGYLYADLEYPDRAMKINWSSDGKIQISTNFGYGKDIVRSIIGATNTDVMYYPEDLGKPEWM